MKKGLFFVIITVSIFAACSKLGQNDIIYKPIVDFSVINANCKAPCNITFANNTRGTYDTEYLWSFGDGDTSRLENPVHQYSYSGDFNVELRAKNKIGLSFINKNVTIQTDLPIGFFSLCRVERITYLKLPATKPDGKPWDDLPGTSALPDLQWLVRDTSRTIIRGQELSQLVNFDSKLLPFVVPREGLSGSLRLFSQYYTLVVQDADVDGPEIMGSFRFRPIDHFPEQPDKATVASSFQTEFKLSTTEGLEILVTLNWQ